MKEKSNSLVRLVQDIFSLRGDEIQCKHAGVLIAQCADALFSDEESQRQYSALWRHFHFCPDCAAEYYALMDMVRLEAAGQLEQPARIPSRPDKDRPARWPLLQDAVRALFPGFSPALAEAIARGKEQDVGSETNLVDVALAGGKLQILFDVAINEQDANLRDLFCTVSTADEDLQAAFEGSPVWLQMGDDGPSVQEKALNELGGVTFSHMPPGTYTFRLHLGGREYAVTGVTLP